MSSSKPTFFGGVQRIGFGDFIASKERGIYAASMPDCIETPENFERPVLADGEAA
jgi:hypothetical protein